MNTIDDIIEWIENYDNPDENIEVFAYELGKMLKDMDYTAYNGGAAVGYAGVTGNYEGVSYPYWAAKELTGNQIETTLSTVKTDEVGIFINNKTSIHGGSDIVKN